MNLRNSGLVKRRERFLVEITKRNWSRINKVKYYGITSNIDKYRKLIYDTFFDEKLINEISKQAMLETTQEDLNSSLDLLNNELVKRINQIWAKVSEILFDAFRKGSKRVILKSGSLVKVPTAEDDPGIQELIKKQDTYFKNLSKDQTQLILNTIAESRKQGVSPNTMADLIVQKVKELSIVRARMIARTEVVRSHNIGQVKVMKELDVKTYNFITANDSKVCKICKKYQGPISNPHKYLVEMAGTKDNPLPAVSTHPHCRCCIIISKESETK